MLFSYIFGVEYVVEKLIGMPKLGGDTSRSYTTKYRNHSREAATASGDQQFYNSWKWRQYSLRYRKANPLCEVAKLRDEVMAVDVVDHIIPISQGGAPWHPDNHMSMSHHYHNRKRGYERHGPLSVIETIETDEGLVPKDRTQVKLLFERGEGGYDL